jgi:hypothetical protein
MSIRLAYQPSASGIFLSEQISHQPNERAAEHCTLERCDI